MSEAAKQGAALMAAIKHGHEAALGELVTLWQEPLLRFIYRYVQNETDARELVHETFVRLYATRGSFRPEASFTGWIFTIAANLARNHARSARRRRGNGWARWTSDTSAAEPACPRPSPDGEIVQAERVRAVRDAIDALPHDLKTTLLLYEYENLGYREIAAVVGCSEKGVEARLSRARARLRESLRRFLEPPTAVRAVPAPVAP